MTQFTVWLERFRNRFWALPALGIVLAVAGGIGLPRIDDSVALPPGLEFTAQADTARSTLQLIATLAVSMAGISFSVIVVALVLASQQLSPRVLQAFQRNPLNQSVLTVFLATAAFSLYVLSAVDSSDTEQVPEFSVGVAMLLAGASLVLFVFFLHHMVRSLNASAVIRRIAADGHQAVHARFPAGAGDEPDDPQAAQEEIRRRTRGPSMEVRAPRAGYVASLKAAEVIKAAEEQDAFVQQDAVIGQFVVTGAVLARVWAPETAQEQVVDAVSDAFLLNEERVVDDDIAFPLRQLSDIALKGLSPGINDPTTAENAMDSVADTLVRASRQPKPSAIRVSNSGHPRLHTRRLDFDDLVRLGFDQVRRDGARRPSFAVRLLELLADIRANGGQEASESQEIGRQAQLICEEAAGLAGVGADAELVENAFDELRLDRQDAKIAVPAGGDGRV